MKRPLYIISLLLLVVLLVDCAYYNTFYNARKFYQEAEKERKKREKTQVVELSPEEEAQLKKTGRVTESAGSRAGQTEMQNYQQAIERASRVLEYYPQSGWVDDALMLLGRCFYYRRDFKKAMRKFDELLQLYPNSEFVSTARLLKARTNIGLEEFDLAEEQLRELSNDDEVRKKVREEARFELGGLYYKKQNYEQAAENFASSARSADDKLIKAMAQYRLGECLIRLKRYEEAPDVLRRAIKAAPNEDFQSQATFKLGEAYSLNSDYERAIRTFRTALAKEFDEKRIPRIKLELANNLRLQGELSEALKWYENIIEEHKRTDASARSYFALAEIEEFGSQDYKKAKENYDLVRSEFANSLIAPIAQERSNNIKTLLDLKQEIAKLEGRAVEADSAAEESAEVANQRDDGPIDLSMDGIWVNYSGRDRPPPITLRELSDTDLARQASMKERVAEMLAAGDSSKIDQSLLAPAELDSVALAEKAAKEALDKETQLSAKYLALAEVMLFAFTKPDSAIKYYQVVVEKRADSVHVARALYSLAYVYTDFKVDTVLAQTVLRELVDLFPGTNHAEGARKILGLDLKTDRIDSAKVTFDRGETAFYRDNNLDKAFELWDRVAEKYPKSEYAHKAAFAKAWHLENTLFKLDDAIKLYQALVDSFPESPYVAQIKPKLAEVDKVRKAAEARQKAIADSVAKAEAAAKAAAEPKTAPADSTVVPADNAAETPAIDLTSPSADVKPGDVATQNDTSAVPQQTPKADSAKTQPAPPPDSLLNQNNNLRQLPDDDQPNKTPDENTKTQQPPQRKPVEK